MLLGEWWRARVFNWNKMTAALFERRSWKLVFGFSLPVLRIRSNKVGRWHK
jgi:hypothetical protein